MPHTRVAARPDRATLLERLVVRLAAMRERLVGLGTAMQELTLAAALGDAGGMAQSPQRWFWAVITARVMFINVA